MWIYLNQHHNGSVPKEFLNMVQNPLDIKVEYLGVDNSQSGILIIDLLLIHTKLLLLVKIMLIKLFILYVESK